MLWKCCTQYASKFGKFSSGWKTGKRSIFISIPKKGNAKECSNYDTIALISHASKVMLKILQATFQQYVNHELPDVQAGFRKGRGTRDQIANIRWIIEKVREFQEKSISSLLTMPKPLTVCITINCGKFFKRWEYQTTWSVSWEICMQVRKLPWRKKCQPTPVLWFGESPWREEPGRLQSTGSQSDMTEWLSTPSKSGKSWWIKIDMGSGGRRVQTPTLSQAGYTTWTRVCVCVFAWAF